MNLTIRALPGKLHRRLDARAMKNGRSPEGEARALIVEALAAETRLEDAMAAINETQVVLRAANGGELPKGVVDEFLAENRRTAADELARIDRYLDGKSSAV